MIRTEEKAPAGAAAPEGASLITTDPVEIIARAMLELDFQGRTVNAESLGEATELTEAEIEENWRAARDLARTRKRNAGREAA